MYRRPLTTLLITHYLFMGFNLLMLLILYFINDMDKYHMGLRLYDLYSTEGTIIQWVVIMDALICIPFGLYWFKRKCETLRLIDDYETKVTRYVAFSIVRLVLVLNSMLLGCLAFYVLGGHKPMLWVAAISAIAWMFCKPSGEKMENDLDPNPYDHRD